MKRWTFPLAAIVLAIGALGATSNPAPPIQPQELVPYAHGTARIVGRIPGADMYGTEIFCAPDTPYVEWYLSSWRPTPLDYDVRMMPYTRVVSVGINDGFTCEHLAHGTYIVWAFVHGQQLLPQRVLRSEVNLPTDTATFSPGSDGVTYETATSVPVDSFVSTSFRRVEVTGDRVEVLLHT